MEPLGRTAVCREARPGLSTDGRASLHTHAGFWRQGLSHLLDNPNVNTQQGNYTGRRGIFVLVELQAKLLLRITFLLPPENLIPDKGHRDGH